MKTQKLRKLSIADLKALQDKAIQELAEYSIIEHPEVEEVTTYWERVLNACEEELDRRVLDIFGDI